jgi:hypothetical protein
LAVEVPAQAAWLWSHGTDTDAEVIYVDNLAVYIAELGLLATEASGDEVGNGMWRQLLGNADRRDS